MQAPSAPPGAADGSTWVIFWGVGGVLFLLAQATARLGALAWEALRSPLSATQWAVLGAWLVFSAYTEGYRGFQLRFSPRVVARALWLSRSTGSPRWHRWLAPLFCMSFFHASRRGLAVAWGILVMVLALVTLVRLLPQPWRGIVDAGVVLGLCWGMVAIVIALVRHLRGDRIAVDLELPPAAEAR